MVVGHLGVVEHLLRLRQRLALERGGEGLVAAQPLQDARTLGVDVVAEVGGVHAGIGGNLLLVEGLDELQRVVGRVGKLLVALHLQRGEVEQPWRRLPALAPGDGGHGERLLPDLSEQLQAAGVVGDGVDALLLVGLAHQCGKGGAAVHRAQLPVLAGREVLYLQLAVHYQCQGGRLHPPDGEYLPALPVLHGVEARGVQPQQPVADGAGQAGLVEGLEVGGGAQGGEALADGLLGERRYPQPLHGAAGAGLLHHPALDELALLPGIAAVDDEVGGLHQPLDDAELPLVGGVVDEPDAEAGWYHGQAVQPPGLPLRGVLVGLLQGTEVAEGPSHLVPVALHVPLLLYLCAQHLGNVPRHGRLFGYADYHRIFLVLAGQRYEKLSVRY